jgi:hypothetical protein
MSIGNFRSHFTCFLLVLLSCFCGCINGPARMRLNGKLRYITVETARQCSWEKCLYGVPAAAVTDLGIIAADTVLVPLYVFFYASGSDDCLGPMFWVFWLPFYPLACVLCPFAYEDKPDDNGALLYRKFWGFRYLDSASGTLKLFELNTPPSSRTMITCNEQRVSEILGQIHPLDSSQDNLAALTFQGQLYWWTRDDAGWKLQQHNYIPSNDALLEYGRQQLEKDPSGKTAVAEWQQLQELVGQTPVKHRYSFLRFVEENELRYGLYFIYPDGEIYLSCHFLLDDEKPQITFLNTKKSSQNP